MTTQNFERIKCKVQKNFNTILDNQFAIKFSNNPEFHKRSKNIDVHFHFVRDLIEAGKIYIDYIKTDEQIADIFTKPLPKEQFSYLRNKLPEINFKI